MSLLTLRNLARSYVPLSYVTWLIYSHTLRGLSVMQVAPSYSTRPTTPLGSRRSPPVRVRACVWECVCMSCYDNIQVMRHTSSHVSFRQHTSRAEAVFLYTHAHRVPVANWRVYTSKFRKNIHPFLNICIYLQVCIYLHKNLCVFTCTHICIYAHIHSIYLHIYIYICIHTCVSRDATHECA